MADLNPGIYYDNGVIHSEDPDLERIIRSVEEENKATIAAAVPAVTFEGGDPDDKVYLLLLTIFDSVENYTCKEWMIKVGRQATYDYLKDLVRNEAIDPAESFVIVGEDDPDIGMNKDNATFNCKPITVFRFLKVMFDERRVLDDKEDFDINEYDPMNYEHGDKTIMEI